MQFSLFGFKLIRAEEEKSSVQTFVKPSITDELGVASLISPPTTFVGFSNGVEDSNKTEVSENALIQQYREIARNPEVDKAIQEIVSEAIITDELSDSVKIDLADVDLSEPIKEKIRESFKKILRLLNFKTKGYDIFRIWYVDGRTNYHIIIDEENINSGIIELRYIDPKKIKRVRELVKGDKIGTSKYIEYFEYNEQGIDSKSAGQAQGIKISADSIAHANSGLTNPSNTIIISYLDKAIAPANKLRMLEHSMVIYRLVRAPERRLIYVDTGNLPKARAEQYMQSIVGKYKTKITYDTVTGKIKDDRNIMALTEDYFIPRQNGSKSTEFTTLQGNNGAAGAVDELEYLKKQLLESLDVPVSRLESNTTFNIGRSGEISREEARFAKHIQRLRTKFNELFNQILAKEVVLKRILSIEEWEEIKHNINYDYLKDNYFTELLETDALANRLGVLAQIEPYVGKYYSEEFVKRNILKLTDDDIKEIDNQIKKEKESDINAHVPVETMHQLHLQNQLAATEIDKHSAQSTIDAGYEADSNKPNPFRG